MYALKVCHDFIKQNQTAIIDGYLCNSMAEFDAVFGNKNSKDDFIFADLTMGVWKANHIASEFLSQIKTPQTDKKAKPNNYGTASELAGSYLQFANIAGEGIDAESLGDSNLNNCIDFCSEIFNSLSENSEKIFIVLLPFDASNIYRDNEIFLYFFAAAIKKTKHQLFAISAGEKKHFPKIHFNWLNKNHFIRVENMNPANQEDIINLVPGIVHRDLVTNPDYHLVEISNHYFLIPPENRIPIAQINKLKFDKLSLTFKSNECIKAYSLYNGNNYFMDGVFLSKYAWKQFGEGARDLAFTLLTKVFNCAPNNIAKAATLCQLQGLRIALWKFNEVANTPIPSGVNEISIKRFLLIAKGWGAVMTGDLENATTCLNEARKCFNPSENASREFMYLLNISALLLVKKGAMETAMELEKQIEENIQHNKIEDYRLHFVNSINLARLYKRNKEFPLALEYFLKAFNTTSGLKQESDFVYCNFILSNAYSDAGNIEASFFCLLRSALNLLSTVFTKSVSKRLYVALGLPAIAQEQERDTTADIYNYFIPQFLNHQYLIEKFGNIDIYQLPDTEATPFFISGRLFDKKITTAIGLSGISILISEETATSISYKPESKLPNLVFKLICHLFENNFELTKAKSIIIDTNFGFDIPQSIQELIAVAVQLKAEKIIWEQDEIILPLVNFQSAIFPFKIEKHPGISKIMAYKNELVVNFKRYYPSIVISNDLLPPLKKLLLNNESLDEKEIKEITLEKLTWLQENKIIKITFNTIELCKKDGCKLHLNEI